ncbi:MAG: hypothetical protein U1A23_03060 [Candidatus Sungbacteria bacterium]|nr:hypothetical protein [Candidatus Sungbacteria bacterium]
MMLYNWCGCLGDYDPSLPYDEFIIAQSHMVKQRTIGTLGHDVLILTAHPPTITLGARSVREQISHIRVLPPEIYARHRSDDELFEEAKTYLGRHHHINLVKTNRGGSLWYHDHGVLQLYLVARVNPFGKSDVIDPLEEVMRRVLCDIGISAARADNNIRRRNNSFIGLWVKHKRIAALGVRIQKGGKHFVSMFGASLNIKQCQASSACIDPCGITGCEMTSIAQELGNGYGIPHSWIVPLISKHTQDVFDIQLIEKKFRPWEKQTCE